MTKLCATCGNEFEHVQQGRGRPPKFCPACREAKYAPAPKKEVVLDAEGNVVRPERVLLSSRPKVGDRVVHTGLKVSPKFYNVAKLLKVDGETATVLYKGETITTRYGKLSLFR